MPKLDLSGNRIGPGACLGLSETKQTYAGLSVSETMVKPPTPKPGATILEQKAYVDYQLDSLMGKSLLVEMRLLPGPSHRLYGGVFARFFWAMVHSCMHSHGVS